MIRTMALNGQLMVFQVARRSALTTLHWDAINAERLSLIKRVVLEQTAALLRSMTAARDSGCAARGRKRGAPRSR